jgi:N-acetylglucosaminyldiphosphoundecaprenol N-acetyl-beta-D-mannosaminyltransferase
MGRVYGPDLMLEVFRLSEQRGYKQFLCGGNNGVAEAMRAEMARQFPKLQVVGTYEPPFRPLTADEERDLIAQVAAAKPDIMWVGLSTPKQERFMAKYLAKLDVTLMAGVGAAFNFYCGRVQQAPRWVQRSGFEWLFRCLHEPRLWKRYGVIVPVFLIRVGAQLSGLKKHELELKPRPAGPG